MNMNYCNLCDSCILGRDDSNEYQEIHITIDAERRKIIIEDKMSGSINVHNIGNSVAFTILVPNVIRG